MTHTYVITHIVCMCEVCENDFHIHTSHLHIITHIITHHIITHIISVMAPLFITHHTHIKRVSAPFDIMC